MGFNSGEYEIEQPVTNSDRRTFLTVLDAVVQPRAGLACGIVYVGGTPVLNVISTYRPDRSVRVGADYVDWDWWFTWFESGETIGLVDAPEGVADVIAHHLHQARTSRAGRLL